jgi:tetratricopeptide (TPR) repeat protein
MAEALANLEKYEEAIKQASLAIETAPKMTQAYTLRARIFAMEDKVDEALNDLNSAIDLDPGDLQALLVRAELHLLKEKYDAARKDVESAMRARPGLAMAVLLRSRISSAEGHDAKEKKKKTLSRIKFAAAMQDIRLLISHDPENVEWQMQLAFLHSADGQPRKAISVLNQAVKKHDDSARAYRSRADAYLSVGKHAEAIKDYEKSIELDPKFEGALNNLAWVLATSPKDEVRDGKRALELAKKACEVTEYKASYILSTLASAHAELGDFEEAIKWSKKAVELSEDHLKEQLGDELKSYEEGKPWRELQETEENPDFKAPAGDVVET